MGNISDSAGTRVDLRENAGVDIWRRVTFSELDPTTGLDDYTVFLRLEPRGGEVIDITPSVAGNVVEFSFSTDLVASGTPYEFGWVNNLNSREDIIFYGNIITVGP